MKTHFRKQIYKTERNEVEIRPKTSVADPDPGLGAFLTPGSGIRDGRKSASGSGIQDEQPGSYFLELRNHFFAFFGLKYLNSLMRIRHPGWRQFGSGMEKSRIRDKHPGSATLPKTLLEAKKTKLLG
jgi:hypothetical protein